MDSIKKRRKSPISHRTRKTQPAEPPIITPIDPDPNSLDISHSLGIQHTPSLICLNNKDWEIKKEICHDEVSEHWGTELSRRNDSNQFYGIVHESPETVEEITVESSGKSYTFTIFTSRFCNKDGKISSRTEDCYETYCVTAETDDSIITGNFLTAEVAVMWIEGLLE